MKKVIILLLLNLIWNHVLNVNAFTYLEYKYNDSVVDSLINPNDTLPILEIFFSFNDECDKLNYYDTVTLTYTTYKDDMVDYFVQQSGIHHQMWYGYPGIFYPTDSLYKDDLRKWKEYYNCLESSE